jgi:hypothetical protein
VRDRQLVAARVVSELLAARSAAERYSEEADAHFRLPYFPSSLLVLKLKRWQLNKCISRAV